MRKKLVSILIAMVLMTTVAIGFAACWGTLHPINVGRHPCSVCRAAECPCLDYCSCTNDCCECHNTNSQYTNSYTNSQYFTLFVYGGKILGHNELPSNTAKIRAGAAVSIQYVCEHVFIQPVPTPFHYFLGWYEGDTLLSTNALFEFYMPARDKTLNARYEIRWTEGGGNLPSIARYSTARCCNREFIERTDEQRANLNRSQAIQGQALAPFGNHYEMGWMQKSKNFAGIWYCQDGYLNIGVVGSIEGLSTFDGQVVYHQFQFSYGFLYSIMQALPPVMAKYRISSLAVCQRCNVLLVSINNRAMLYNIVVHLLDLGLFEREAIHFIVPDSNRLAPVRRTLEGVEMVTERDFYETDVSEIVVAWKNGTDRTLMFGESFHIEKKINGQWYVLSFGEVWFTSIGFELPPNSQTSHTYNIHHFTDSLAIGKYRIAASFFATADIPVTADNMYWVFAEFEVVSNAGLQGHFFRIDSGDWLANFPIEEFRALRGCCCSSEAIVFRSREKLQLFFDQVYSKTFSGTEWIKNENFSNALKSFDDDFFKHHNLVAFVVESGNAADYFTLDNVFYDDNLLSISLRQHFGVGDTIMTGWLALIEIPVINADAAMKINDVYWSWRISGVLSMQEWLNVMFKALSSAGFVVEEVCPGVTGMWAFTVYSEYGDFTLAITVNIGCDGATKIPSVWYFDNIDFSLDGQRAGFFFGNIHVIGCASAVQIAYIALGGSTYFALDN